jgi:hypothetical protein
VTAVQEIVNIRFTNLKDKDIRIKRSSGDIENGWIMDNPIICFSQDNGRETIHCYNKEKDIGKNCECLPDFYF